MLVDAITQDFQILGTVVGLSLSIVTAYLLGLGTANFIGIVWFCVRNKSGLVSKRLTSHSMVTLLCYSAGNTSRSHRNDPPVTTANEAYGTRPPPVSMDQNANAPVYDSAENVC